MQASIRLAMNLWYLSRLQPRPAGQPMTRCLERARPSQNTAPTKYEHFPTKRGHLPINHGRRTRALTRRTWALAMNRATHGGTAHNVLPRAHCSGFDTRQSNTGTFQSHTGTLQPNSGTLQSNAGTLQSNTEAFQSTTGAFPTTGILPSNAGSFTQADDGAAKDRRGSHGSADALEVWLLVPPLFRHLVRRGATFAVPSLRPLMPRCQPVRARRTAWHSRTEMDR